jgi:hypothetical protein
VGKEVRRRPRQNGYGKFEMFRYLRLKIEGEALYKTLALADRLHCEKRRAFRLGQGTE